MAGTLYVVATPIGNLEDITLRALRILREVDLVACEDTRRTRQLLTHYQISRPVVSLREHNEGTESDRLVERLLEGTSIALVSDAGTPAIADPGALFVSRARAAGVPVVPIPGPSAILAALSVSGIPAERFTFMGFPPSSGEARKRWLEQVAREEGAVVALEAPHRIKRTLQDLGSIGLNRRIHVFREITKIHESYTVHQNIDMPVPERGEFTLVLEPPSERPSPDLDESEIVRLFDQMAEAGGIGRSETAAILGSHFGVDPQRILKAVKKSRLYLK